MKGENGIKIMNKNKNKKKRTTKKRMKNEFYKKERKMYVATTAFIASLFG